MSNRVFVLGIDGGEFRVVDHLAAAGELPNLRALMARGLRRPLRSTTPPLTPAAWASFYTGTNPGRHGVADFVARREGTYRLAPVHRNHVAGRSLWRAAAEGGRRPLVANVPLTFPPEEVDGWLISGMDTPGPRNSWAWPPELRDEVLALDPGYAPDVHVSRRDLARDRHLRKRYPAEVLALEERRARVVGHLARTRHWGFGMLVITAADRLQHVFWADVERALAGGTVPPPSEPAGAVFEAYRLADRMLPELLDLVGPDGHLLVVSDHGFGPLDRDVNLNVLLERLGFLRFLPGARPSRLETLAAGVKAALPRGLRDLLWKVLPPPAVTRLEGLDVLERTVDWDRTRAYAVGYLGGIYLNLEGREPRGIVRPADRAAVAAELTAALVSFRDPEDGLPLVTAAEANPDIYHGPRAGLLPDLVLTLKDHRCTARHSFSGPGEALFSRPQEDFGPLAHTGSHRPDGILVASGPLLDGREAPERPSIMDLFPTCLELLGLSVPAGLDGASLLGTSPPPKGEAPDMPAGEDAPRLSAEEEGQVLDHLRDLGYV